MPRIFQVSGEVLGIPRMQRYLSDCGGDPARAQQLFEWHLETAGAFHSSLHLFEVIIRNAMDNQLRAWNDSQGFGHEWLLNPDPRLQRLLHAPTLEKARTRARQTATAARRHLKHDDVLAQMTFGTWRYLLPSNSSIPKQRLWEAATSHAFPRWVGPWPTLVSRIVLIHEFRNRVAHLEPLHAQNVRRVRRAMRHICSGVSYEAGRIYAQADRTAKSLPRLREILGR